VSEPFDIADVGAAAIARDAAAQGLETLLIRRGDLATSASSASTKLVRSDEIVALDAQRKARQRTRATV
jgi:hypothetical protein